MNTLPGLNPTNITIRKRRKILLIYSGGSNNWSENWKFLKSDQPQNPEKNQFSKSSFCWTTCTNSQIPLSFLNNTGPSIIKLCLSNLPTYFIGFPDTKKQPKNFLMLSQFFRGNPTNLSEDPKKSFIVYAPAVASKTKINKMGSLNCVFLGCLNPKDFANGR